MSTHRHIDKICIAIISLLLVFSLVLLSINKTDAIPAAEELGYEARLFDTSKVHTVEIKMEGWDAFLETCENEEYSECTVIIDGETYKNVGIRAKGNTSLSSVKKYGNNRYSFKIEFDCYDSGRFYHGLDKISLNNIIQDNTYMKDYLCYQMMGDFGVAAPLCSYAYITVNGDDWGLYLAAEAVEESFLKRNYGNDYGELYKPDSMDMGGGRGNGVRFEEDGAVDSGEIQPGGNVSEGENIAKGGMPDEGNMPENTMPGGGTVPPEEAMPQDGGDMPQPDGDMSQLDGDMPQPDGAAPPVSGNMPPGGDVPEEGNIPEGSMPDEGNMPENIMPGGRAVPPEEVMPQDGGDMPQVRGGMAGSADVSLIYSDDDYDSYTNIFDNAKTDITDKDKDRLISSLKDLNEGKNIAETVDIEQVIRYFAVHNFVCNFDSYTGSMLHNYYLYEKDGQLSMIPWDYNLAFGGFEAGTEAEDLINYPIDTPVSGGTISERPMLAWIFENEEYTSMYHAYLAEFIENYFDSGRFAVMTEQVSQMIAPYVEKDPTKFCTYEEFETGVETLEKFCLLRAESVNGQIDGIIPATADAQKEEKSMLVDAEGIQISDMGSMR